MVANIRGLTPNYNFKLINFDTPRWHTLEYDNWNIVDSMFLQLGTPPIRGVWENSTQYTVGERVFDEDTTLIYRCLVTHVSAAAGSFDADRVANPTYWTLQELGVPVYRDLWTPSTVYAMGDIVCLAVEFEYYLCVKAHTSAATFSSDVAYWQMVFDPSDTLAAAEAAQAAAEAAQAASEGSANDSASSATESSGYATNSANSAVASANSATASQTSATNSANSATASATSATNSANSATASQTSANASAASAVEAASQAASLKGTSLTSNTVATGSKTFVTQANKQFNVGNFMTIVDTANPTVNVLTGQITAYSGTTLQINITAALGSGTIADWQLYISGSRGLQGIQGVQGIQGIQGVKGDIGNTGATGAQGTQGVQGPIGPVGPEGPVGPQGEMGLTGPAGTGSGDMLRSANLSDVISVSSARTNLGLKNSATRDVGTIANTVAAGDDARITGAASTTYVDTKDALKADKTYVDTQDALNAPLASPTFTGDPKAPTPTAGDNDTSIATTAFVQNAVVSNAAIPPSNITFPPSGGISGTNVLAAIQELDNEKVAKAGDTMTGDLIISKASPLINLTKSATAQNIAIAGFNAGSPRWSLLLGSDDLESGSSAGSNFKLNRFNDAGAFVDTPIAVARSTGIVTINGAQLFAGIPIVPQSTSYTLVATDAQKCVLIGLAASTITIPANATVPFPVGTCVTFINNSSGGNASLAITTDTMTLGGNATNTTGTRTLANNGVCTALKTTATTWFVSGAGLT